MERAERLLKEGVLPQQASDDARSTLEQAENRQNIAKSQFSVSEAKISQAQAAVEQAQATVERAEEEFNNRHHSLADQGDRALARCRNRQPRLVHP